ncbi:MAG: PCMD domain-containing protein [Bacteroidota bacterium]
MKKITSLFITISATITSLVAQPTPQFPNASFELWENATTSIEPTFYNSNKTGTGWATSGPQTCFQETSIVHSGTYAVRLETGSALGTAVNGALTSGIVNAPTINKIDGYIGTIEGALGTDIRRIAFDGRPDSLIGWYRYTQSTSTGGTGGANEIGKVRAVLHLGNYYDPETPSNSNHPDSSANKIGAALFLTPASNVGTWTRFSVPFVYVSAATPQYVLINATPSNNQLTSVTGSKLWLDDIGVVYNSHVGITESSAASQSINVYAYDKKIVVDFSIKNEEQSTLSVYDVTGKLVSKQNVSNNKINTINLGQLPSGLYFYDLSGSTFHKSGKLIFN